MNKLYVGIGARDCSEPYLTIMYNIGATLAQQGWTLRSGGAIGADTAFQKGCESTNGIKEIYIPWNSYNFLIQDINAGIYAEENIEAETIAKKYHPFYDYMSKPAKKLMCRNSHQVLGRLLDTPANIMICYTRDKSTGKTSQYTGGTGQAIRIAHDLNIPIFNLANLKDMENLTDLYAFIDLHTNLFEF